MNNTQKKILELKPMLRIGKSGISEGLIKEIRLQLKKKKIIKIKFLKSAFTEKSDITSSILSSINASLVGKIGNTITLQKK